MGFLDSFFGTPEQTQALGLLGASLMKGKGADGFLLANQYMAEAPDRQLKRQFTQAQLQETLAQAEERKQRTELTKRQLELQNQLLFGSPVPPASLSSAPAAAGGLPGGGAILDAPDTKDALRRLPASGGLPPAAGGLPGGGAVLDAGFIRPQGAGSQGGLIGVARQMGIPEHAIQADIAFNGGKGIAEMLFKRGVPDMTVSNGYVFDKNRVGPGYLPQLNVSQDGKSTMVRIGPDGLPVVSAPPGAYNTFAGYQGIQEDAKAGRDLVKIIDANGTERYVTRAQAVQATQPQQPQAAPPVSSRGNPADADRYAILTQELQRAEASGNAVDAAAIRNEINRLPASARMTPSPSGLTVAGPMQSAPSPEQAASAAAAKEKAVMDAKAESERQAGRTKKADQASDMLSNIARARQLMTEGATGSLIGAGVDKVMGAGGFSTQSSTNADKLETISGWLVANVPRMEGPQSNYDVQNYQVMAGRVGDRSYPIAGRLAALDEIERIQRKYARLNTGATPTQPTRQTNLPQPMKGMVRNGYRFKGGDPSKQENWEKM